MLNILSLFILHLPQKKMKPGSKGSASVRVKGDGTSNQVGTRFVTRMPLRFSPQSKCAANATEIR